ncbi:hypothetical protein MP228_012948 [Amoeboaphelidium protococcarum]|nr:hypothetical protein MP228_012948 [Amoeboaphelidium protococcarum]
MATPTMVKLLPKQAEKDAQEITWEDQSKINQFAKLNIRRTEKKLALGDDNSGLLYELQATKDALETVEEMVLLEDVDEDLTDLDIQDDDEVDNNKSSAGQKNSNQQHIIPVQIGGSFYDMEYQRAQEFLERRSSALQEQIDQINNQLIEIEGQMNQLKSDLYAKLGQTINLEFE